MNKPPETLSEVEKIEQWIEEKRCEQDRLPRQSKLSEIVKNSVLISDAQKMAINERVRQNDNQRTERK